VNRLARLTRKYVREFRLDLKGFSVLTEAATGHFAAAAALAALAGGRVWAAARSNRFGSAGKAVRETSRLARALGADRRIAFVNRPDEAPLGEIDIVTNSGNVRPLPGTWLRKLPRTAVVTLMVEPWRSGKRTWICQP